MRTGSIRFTIEGNSLEKLINHCLSLSIELESVQRKSDRSISATVSSKGFGAVRAFSSEQGWVIHVNKTYGLPYVKRFAWRRAALAAGVLVFLALAWYAGNCVWSIEITNAGAYEGEVRHVLDDNQIQLGRFAPTIDIEKLRASLEDRLTGLSWVSVDTDGTRLRVYCVQGINEANAQSNEKGDVYATRDGVIQSVRASHGTAAVKYGEAVKKGQVLIKGEERAAHDEVTRVTAQGEVFARVWYSAEVFVPNAELLTIPTGRTHTIRTYVSPWNEVTRNATCDFTAFDSTLSIEFIGGILPLYMKTETFEEVRYELRQRNEAELRQESATAALRKAHELAGVEKQIVDKWVEYSIMDDGIKATATIELLENIAGE